MNKLMILALATLAVLPLATVNAQSEKSKTHRVVFEVTMEGTEQWTAA